MEELVSIIMPNYNAEQFIAQAIESVQQQTYVNWELLITDDQSEDNSFKIAQRYAQKDKRIKLFKNEFKKGAAGARNTSTQYAQGRFIAFLDNDDQWLPFHLEKRINHMMDHHYDFTYSWYDKVNEKGIKIATRKPSQPFDTYTSLLTLCSIGCFTAIYDTKKIGKIYGPYLKTAEDFALWLQILKKVGKVYVYPAITGISRDRKDSLSSSKLRQMRSLWAVYRQVEKFSIPQSLFLFSIFVVRYFNRAFFSERLKNKTIY